MCLASASCLEMWKVVLGDLKFMLVELVPLTLDMKFSKGGGCPPYLFGVTQWYSRCYLF